MGQKDYQQLSIVREMLKQLSSTVKLVMCNIIRESDGLAMSSRNRRLSKQDRINATLIYQTLQKAKALMGSHSPEEIKAISLSDLNEREGVKPEYFDIVDGITLLPIKNFDDVKLVVACTAAWVGEVRLIDNLILKQ